MYQPSSKLSHCGKRITKIYFNTHNNVYNRFVLRYCVRATVGVKSKSTEFKIRM